MTINSLQEAAEVLHISKELEKVPATEVPGPLQAVEQALSTFLTHRLRKLQEDTTFEERIKDALEARIPEMSINDLMRVLEIVQSSNNEGVERVLTPFLSKSNVGFDNQRQTDIEEQIFRSSSKDMLQGFAELNRLVSEIAKNKQSTAEDVKEAITVPIPGTN